MRNTLLACTSALLVLVCSACDGRHDDPGGTTNSVGQSSVSNAKNNGDATADPNSDQNRSSSNPARQ